MGKLFTSIINTLLSTYITVISLICLAELDTWQDKIIAVIMITGSAYVITLILNRILPKKIRISGGVFDLVSGPLLITGAIACIALPEPWPVKIIGLFLWVMVMLYMPSLINKN